MCRRTYVSKLMPETRRRITPVHLRQMLWLLAFIFLSIIHGGAAAAELASFAGEKLRLIGATSMPDKVLLVGVEMKMAPGWHSYWRRPGDSGIAPSFDWSASENLSEVNLLWPAPERFDLPDDMTVGYQGRVVWPVLVKPADPARPVKLRLHMRYGVCSDICVPGDAELTLDMPADATDENGLLIRQYLARVPVAPDRNETVSARLDGGNLLVTLRDRNDTPALIVEGPKGIWFGKPDVKRDGGLLSYTIAVGIAPGSSLKGNDVTLTFSGATTALEVTRKIE
jgi:DsbC/DsbD-like thiol-disulfide interchange protein